MEERISGYLYANNYFVMEHILDIDAYRSSFFEGVLNGSGLSQTHYKGT
ncbi:hypothetical protein ACSVDE_17265 [Pseudalkalibacillus sp. Hm43]